MSYEVVEASTMAIDSVRLGQLSVLPETRDHTTILPLQVICEGGIVVVFPTIATFGLYFENRCVLQNISIFEKPESIDIYR